MEKSNPLLSETTHPKRPNPFRFAGASWLILLTMAAIALVGAKGWHLWVDAGSERDALLVEIDSLRHELKKSHPVTLFNDLRIIPLESDSEGGGKAVIAWSQRSQQGIIEVLNLPPGQSYELWIRDTDRAEPVSAGEFLPLDGSTLRALFFPATKLKNPAEFNLMIGDQLILSSSDGKN